MIRTGLTILLLGLLWPASTALARSAQVERVVDGDTVVLAGGERVRVIGVNTPERGERLADEATELTRAYCDGKEVEVLAGPTPKDGYGRTLADVRVLAPAGQPTLAESLLRKGLAHVYLIPPFHADWAKGLHVAQEKARGEGLGIWRDARFAGDFHITSFRANARGDDRTNLNGEYVRIANITAKAQDLAGYTLRDDDGSKYTFPALTVPPGHTVKIHSGKGDNQLAATAQMSLYWGASEPVWNNDGDTAILLNAKGREVDRAASKKNKRKRRRKRKK